MSRKLIMHTPLELVSEYRQGKNKKQMIEALAELNCVKQSEIIEILKENGVDQRELPRNRKKLKPKELVQEHEVEVHDPDVVELAAGTEEEEDEGMEEKTEEVFDEAKEPDITEQKEIIDATNTSDIIAEVPYIVKIALQEQMERLVIERDHYIVNLNMVKGYIKDLCEYGASVGCRFEEEEE